jgi:hypothetical protein
MKKGKTEKEVREVSLSGVASEEQIAMWKRLHGDVFCVKSKDKVCYLKRPDRKTLSAADAIGSSDPMRYNEIILENCWIGGDTEIKTNDNYFLEVIQILDELVNFGRAEIKKL